MNPKPFSLELQEWQARCGLTQEKAARALDLCLSTYRNWLTGAHHPNRWAIVQVRGQMAEFEAARTEAALTPPA